MSNRHINIIEWSRMRKRDGEESKGFTTENTEGTEQDWNSPKKE